MNIGGAVNIGKEIRVRTGPDIEYYDITNTKMLGKHSVENIMAAILAAREHGAKKEAIQKALSELKDAHKNRDFAAIDTTLAALNTAWAAASEEMYKATQQAAPGAKGKRRTRNGA